MSGSKAGFLSCIAVGSLDDYEGQEYAACLSMLSTCHILFVV